MKKLLNLFALAIIVAVIACKGVKTLSTGLDNQSYLVFIKTAGDYPNGVEVTVDDKNTFTAKVNTVQFKPSRDNVYALASGKHTVSVKSDGAVIYKQEIFVSTQETKKITLP